MPLPYFDALAGTLYTGDIPREDDALLKGTHEHSAWQRTLWGIVAAEVLTILAFQASAILVPYYIQEMGITDENAVAAWTGGYQSAGAIAFAVFTPIWGAVGDRHGRRLMLLRAMIATSVVLVVMGLVRTPSQLMVLRVIQGCVTGTPAAATALLATQAPKNQLAYALGLLQTSLFVGSSLGPMFGGYVGDAFGYRATFFVSGLIVLVALAVVIKTVHEAPHGSAARAKDPEKGASGEAQVNKQTGLAAVREFFSSSAVLTLIILAFAANLTFSLVNPVLPLFIQSLVRNPDRVASVAGTITGVSAISAAVSALVVGKLSDRVGHRLALILCAVGTALLFLPQGFAPTALALGIWLALQGLFRGGIGPNVSAMLASLAPEEQTGTVLGLNSSASSIGFAAGPLLGALLLAATSTQVVYLTAGGLFIAITIVVLLTVRSREQRTQGGIQRAG